MLKYRIYRLLMFSFWTSSPTKIDSGVKLAHLVVRRTFYSFTAWIYVYVHVWALRHRPVLYVLCLSGCQRPVVY